MPTSFNSRPVVAERLAAGTRLGPYEVRTFLGAGGMGAVYRAHDVRLGRDVALKVLPEAVRADATWQARLEREARAAAAINHPNVLALHDVGVHAGAPYLVCELLDGETLRTKLERGPLSAARALQWAQQIAHGLRAAHERGLVHRDLKPANVFVTRGAAVPRKSTCSTWLLVGERYGESLAPVGSAAILLGGTSLQR